MNHENGRLDSEISSEGESRTCISKGKDEIDFVIAWVDGNNKQWLDKKQLHIAEKDCDNRPERYRDWDLLRYWFRGIEKFTPWVRKVHFVTSDHVPEWLDTNHPKLQVVKHADYIPEQYLPTYNSNAIELNFHRIKGLSNQFVYFNDDMFHINHMKKEGYFMNGLPKDMLALQPIVVKPENPIMAYIMLNNTAVLSKYYEKRKNMRSQPFHYLCPSYPPINLGYNMLEQAFPLFTGFYTVHGPSPLLKETYQVLWEREYDVLNETCMHQYRSKYDVNQYLLREWQKLSGEFHAANVQKGFRYFELRNNNQKLLDTIKRQRVNIICMNDTELNIDFAKVSKDLRTAFESILPSKSTFENSSC